MAIRYCEDNNSFYCTDCNEWSTEVTDFYGHKCKPSNKSDGGPAKYYDFNPDWVTLNDLMEDKAMNQWGPYSLHFKDIVKACFRFGVKDSADKEYDTKKILYSALRLLVMIRGRTYVNSYLRELLEDPQFKSEPKVEETLEVKYQPLKGVIFQND